MNWILPRLLRALLLLALGALAGGWAGMEAAVPITGAVIGACLGLLVFVLLDALPALRFMRWLRSPMETPAPRDRRFWGELGYRVERALRLRDKRVEGERQRLAQFLSAIEASPNGVVLLDARDQIEWLNSVAADHLGIEPQRDLAQPITNLVRAPAFVAHMQGGQFGDAVVFPAPRGGTLSVVVREYGEGAKLLMTQDITERARNEAMRRDFVANVSHEIRTPLTVLAGFVDTLASLPLTEVERQRVLVLMRQQTDRMQTLVGDLLTLAQLEGSPRPPADRWLPVGELLQRVESDALGLSQGRHRLRVSAEPADAQVAGVETELLSAVGNLMTNAVRYTPEGGEIELLWHLRPDGGGEFEVRDTGIGIAREHLPRLTERFYRVDGSRSRETGGTGLGLSIVKHVAQRHGGELHVQSEPGKGSSFRLLLPASRVRVQTAATLSS
jgi:two-component system phosphate regulon sensor histidine kinase PhoR